MFLSDRGASLLTVAMLAVAMAGTLTIFTVLTAMSTLWPDLPQRERLARLKFATPGEAIGKSIDLEGDTR